MKFRIRFAVIVVLLILIFGIALLSFSTRNQDPAQTFPATINRDCAPWDGAAFILSVSMRDENIISISIWQSPDIKVPVLFSFPGGARQLGNATYRSTSGEYEQLNGKVFFPRVNRESTVEGWFDLKNEAGEQFKGKFKAQWGNEIVYCG